MIRPTWGNFVISQAQNKTPPYSPLSVHPQLHPLPVFSYYYQCTWSENMLADSALVLIQLGKRPDPKLVNGMIGGQTRANGLPYNLWNWISTTITGVHSNQDQIWLVKRGEYIGFYVYRRSWLLWSPINRVFAVSYTHLTLPTIYSV